MIGRLRTSTSQEERHRLLEEILEPYMRRVARWSLRIASDPDEAAEISQEALLAVCSHIGQFRGDSRFSTWLFTILQNQARRRGTRSHAGHERPLEEALELAAAEPSLEESFENRRRMARLRRLLDTALTPLEARILVLHFANDVPLSVLDRKLGLTNRSGARAYLMSAKRKLRRKLESALARRAYRTAGTRARRSD